MTQRLKGVSAMIESLTRAELDKLPTVVDLVTAGRALGIGRTKAHEMARAGTFPVRVLPLGRRYRVSTAELRDFLRIRTNGESEHAEPAA